MIQRSGGGDYPQEAADIMASDGYPPVDTMLTADPPRHTSYRRLVDKAFSKAVVLTVIILQASLLLHTCFINWFNFVICII